MVLSPETRAFALQRHCELRLDHAGRPVRFEYRNEERDDVREISRHAPEELQAVIGLIDAKERRRAVGERMLADAHGFGIFKALLSRF